MNNSTVAICMATYNGEKYLEEQLNSIINQTYSDWELWIRDDCSTDSTLSIIEGYVKKDKRVHLINAEKRVGASQNFSLVMEKVKSLGYQYIMFADQDDIWFGNKVSESYKKITLDEFKNQPALIHFDFRYVDNNLLHIKTMKNIANKLNPKKNKSKIIINDNYIFGCTMIINKALLDISTPISLCADNHDYWIALNACYFGIIKYYDNKLMLYRQHGSNVSGGLKYSSFSNRLKRIMKNDIVIARREKCLRQFEAFYTANETKFDEYLKRVLLKYISYSRSGGLPSVWFMLRNGFYLRGFPQTAMYYFSLLYGSKTE